MDPSRKARNTLRAAFLDVVGFVPTPTSQFSTAPITTVPFQLPPSAIQDGPSSSRQMLNANPPVPASAPRFLFAKDNGLKFRGLRYNYENGSTNDLTKGTPSNFTPIDTIGQNRQGKGHRKISSIPFKLPVPQFKIPNIKNKEALSKLWGLIGDFLKSQKFKGHKQWKSDYTKVDMSEYFSYWMFVLRLINHPRLPVNTQSPYSRNIESIVEAAKLYNYPQASSINMSSLKNAMDQHSLPSSLAFLGWMCGRVEQMLSPRFDEHGARITVHEGQETDQIQPEDRPLRDGAKFYQELYAEYPESDKKVEEVCKNFKNELIQSTGLDFSVPIDMAQRDEARRELHKLQTLQADRTKDLNDEITGTEQKIRDEKSKGLEIRDSIKKYENLVGLNTNIMIYEKKIKTAKINLEELNVTLSGQKLSFQGKEMALKEISDLGDQVKSLNNVILGSEQKLAQNKQELDNVKTSFHENCQRLKIIEDYNARLDKINQLGVRNNFQYLARNPFDPQGLNTYLKDHQSILENTKQFQPKFKYMINKLVNEYASVKSQLEGLEEECMLEELKYTNMTSQYNSVMAKYTHQLRELKAKSSDLETNRGLLEEEKKKMEKIKADRENNSKKLEELKIEKKNLDDQILDAWLKIREIEDTMNLKIVRASIQHARNLKRLYEGFLERERRKLAEPIYF